MSYSLRASLFIIYGTIPAAWTRALPSEPFQGDGKSAILVLYVMGFAFLYSSVAVALVLLGLALFLTMVAFPSFDKAVRKTVAWLVKRAQRRTTPTYKTEETNTETTTTSVLEQEKVARASVMFLCALEENSIPIDYCGHGVTVFAVNCADSASVRLESSARTLHPFRR